MYMAKANGKAGFAIFDPTMTAVIRERHELATQLLQAVELGQLRVMYQPIVSLATGATEGVEALVRWDHPVRGLVPPGDFIELAEENGAILPIGRWVLAEACRQARTWNIGEVPKFLCVNVSAREIQQPTSSSGRAASRRFRSARSAWRSRDASGRRHDGDARGPSPDGVRIVIDDFGTGYFSLSHLRQFPVDALKIASEFIQVRDGDTKSAALAEAIVAMSKSLGIVTVAEGIETAEQAERMRALGCAYGQGYYFARPLDAEAVAPAQQPAVQRTAAPRRRTTDRQAPEPRGIPALARPLLSADPV
jgi:EAL domain-containing protein (putative c-di-GMP-specific phosphodiesterase class I)